GKCTGRWYRVRRARVHVSSRHWIGLHRAQVSDLLAPRGTVFSIESGVLAALASLDRAPARRFFRATGSCTRAAGAMVLGSIGVGLLVAGVFHDMGPSARAKGD